MTRLPVIVGFGGINAAGRWLLTPSAERKPMRLMRAWRQ
jgi:hypothetical protein